MTSVFLFYIDLTSHFIFTLIEGEYFFKKNLEMN